MSESSKPQPGVPDGGHSDEQALRIQVSVLKTVVAYLLAIDAVQSGNPLDKIHQALVDEYQPETDSASGLKFEAEASQFIDQLFLLAENMRAAVQGR